MRNIQRNIIILFAIIAILAVGTMNADCGQDLTANSADSPLLFSNITNYSYRVINTFPHDSQAFTQGLFFAAGYLYEGTGLNGRSTLRKTDLHTGRVLKSVKLPEKYFGEGVTLCGDKIIQLTWKSGKAFVYNRDMLGLESEFRLLTEGWGITYDGSSLIISDGSSRLYFLNPVTFENTGQVTVSDKNGPVTNLNELEYVQGKIFANVWHTDDILIIGRTTGQVTGRVNLKELTRRSGGDAMYKTLNGIAYDETNNRLFVTGKLWPALYEIELIPNTGNNE